MSDDELLRRAAQLTSVPLTRLADGLQRALRHVAGSDVELTLLLADYRHDTLIPALADAPDVPVGDHPPGRCYVRQQVERESRPGGRERVWLPVSPHGDRLGVLAVEALTGALTLPLVQALAAIAGHTLAAGVSATDGYLAARRIKPLTVAAEMQWALLPGNSFADEQVVVAGQLEPAYAASGDAYDWCRTTSDLLVAVFDAESRGIDAALQTALAVTAFRNARRGGLDLAQMVSLTDQALFDFGRGRWSLPALFLQFDLSTGVARVIDAGSPAMLRLRDGAVTALTPERQLPLGMFEGTLYTAEPLDARAGDRLLVVTDGAHQPPARSPEGIPLEEIAEIVRGTAGQPVWELARAVITAAVARVDGAPEQDIVAVAVDLR